MGERCEILLEKEVYYPGDTINGRVDCYFLFENKVKAIKVKFKSKAKVQWSEGRHSHFSANETYFEMESDLLTKETTFPPGVYSYSFTFPLSNELPSSMNEDNGSVAYSVKSTIDRPWAIDYESKKAFEVHSYHNLNFMDKIKVPYEFCENIVPKLLFISEASGPITVSVRLPVRGFVPSQMIHFSAKLNNDSGVTVEAVHFKLVQGFTFHDKENSTKIDSFIGQEFAIIDSKVAPESEKSWDLELRVPTGMFNRSLQFCNIIKIFWELRGEVFLPFIYKNIKIRVPFVLGNVPVIGTSL